MNYTRLQREAVLDALELVLAEFDRREEELSEEIKEGKSIALMEASEFWAYLRREEGRRYYAFVAGVYSAIVAEGKEG